MRIEIRTIPVQRKDVLFMRRWMILMAAAAALVTAVWQLWRGERDLRRPFVEDFVME